MIEIEVQVEARDGIYVTEEVILTEEEIISLLNKRGYDKIKNMEVVGCDKIYDLQEELDNE